MSLLASMAWTMFAQVTPARPHGPLLDLRDLKGNFGADGVFPITGAVIGIGILLVLIALAAYLHHRRTRDQHPRPWHVYLQLTRQYSLTWPQRLLLLRIARAQGLPSPITLMVCPATLEHHARRYASTQPGREPRIQRQVSEIARRLFGFAEDSGGDLIHASGLRG